MSAARHPSPSFQAWRRWTFAFNVAISILAVTSILGMLNYLAARHYERVHLVADPRLELSPMTAQLLETLTNQVQVVVFFDADPHGTLFSSVKGLLKEYELLCPRLQVEYVDYLRDPGKAAMIKARYHLTASTDVDQVIFDCDGRYKVVHSSELSEYDMDALMRGEEVRRSGFKGEQFFTSAILSVSEQQSPRAYYLVGHGEHDLRSEESSMGYANFKTLLEEKNIEVLPLSLSTNGVPVDAQLLILAGPRVALPDFELAKVGDYLNRGGNALFLLPSPLRPGVRSSGLESLLAEWNVRLGDDLVIDRAQSKADAAQVLLVSKFGDHAVTRALRDLRVALVMPQSVGPTTAEAADALELTALLATGDQGVALSEVRGNRGTVSEEGMVALSVALEKGGIAGVNASRGVARLIVVGESQFLANGPLEMESNRDFASLSVNWLLDRNHLLAINPQPLNDYKVSLSDTQMRSLRWMLLVVLPGSMLGLGVLVWFRRRV